MSSKQFGFENLLNCSPNVDGLGYQSPFSHSLCNIVLYLCVSDSAGTRLEPVKSLQ